MVASKTRSNVVSQKKRKHKKSHRRKTTAVAVENAVSSTMANETMDAVTEGTTPPAADNNMHIWNQVCETDPDFTKEVGFRGGFTSIDPQYQLQRMTETFGPCGMGWGYEAEDSTIRLDDENIITKVTVRVWWRDRDGEVRFLGPVTTTAMLVDGGRVDLDACKKATTDALTKSYSRLGVNADVFLGQFDDPEYVEQLHRKKAGPATADQLKEIKAIAKAKEDGDWLEKVCKFLKIKSIKEVDAKSAASIIERSNQADDSSTTTTGAG